MGPIADEHRDPDELIAEITREFCDGLQERLGTMRSALERLSNGYDREAAEVFYRAAHSLKGTAASFDANELVGPAADLSDAGLRWYESGVLDTAEVPAALVGLEKLQAAVASYAARLEGDASG